MPEASPVVTCGNCGAPARVHARRCEFCRVELKTRRCARCYHLSVFTGLHCGGCGYELGLEPIPESTTLCCPTCKTLLVAFTDAAGRIYDCPECRGQFLEPSTFKGLVNDAISYSEPCALEVPRQNPLTEPVRYRSCPSCGDLMHRKNFGGSSGIIIDTCQKHGTWVDAGELPLIQRFVRAGGLELERRRQDEARARAAQGSGVVFMPSRSPEDIDSDPLRLAASIGSDILRWLADTWH